MITLRIPTARDFWAMLCRLAYRRWAKAEGRKPVGIPGNRDPENPCVMYAPRAFKVGDFQDCMTDGHYLCDECAHRHPDLVWDEDGGLGLRKVIA